MRKITEIIPDDLPDWAVEAMADGQFFNVVSQKIKELEELVNKITEHNDECVRSCNDKKSCGFVGYKSDCGNCTKDWMIEI